MSSDVREKSLIERLEEANGPEDIMFSTREQFAQIFRDRGIDEFGVDFLRGSEGEHLSLFHMAFRSIDAAVALVERTIPDCSVEICTSIFGQRANIAQSYLGAWRYLSEEAHKDSAPLAICIALLKALE